MLACSFMPLLKSNLKDPSSTSSYRAIAGSSLILKLFEKVVLLLWGHHLSSDSLQFGFKARTSTTQCTWLVSEVIQHLLRNDTNPIVTVLDCTKAFDLCKFSQLFNRIYETGMPPIVVRVLTHVHVRGTVCLGTLGKCGVVQVRYYKRDKTRSCAFTSILVRLL